MSDIVKRLEEQLAECRDVLERLETGKIIFREEVRGRPSIHTTQHHIEQRKQDISKYERLLAKVRAE